MDVRLQDYIIDHTTLDWEELLATWAWLLPEEFTVWIMNRFGDLFVVVADGSVHMLDVGGGSFEKVAESRQDFADKADQDEKGADWFMVPLIDRLVERGMILKDGQCYSYHQLPILGGDYEVENVKVVPIEHHYEAFGPIHEKVKDLPDGTQVVFNTDG